MSSPNALRSQICLALLLGSSLFSAAAVMAQDETPDAPPAQAETDAKQNEKEAKEESEQAGEEAEQADLAQSASRAKADAAAKAATEAKAAAEAADEQAEAAQAALDAATEAAGTAKEAAAAEGATPEQKQAAQDADAAVKTAEGALATAKAAAESASKAADALQAEADAALEAYEQAQEEAESAKEAQAEAVGKAKAAEAAKAAMAEAAAMKRGPKVPLGVLELRLVPLTLEELEAEVGEWLKALKTKVTGISGAEIAIKTAEGENKTEILEALTNLRSDRTALIDRFDLVLKEYETKGGDPAAFIKYRDAVSGIKVDVTDASAAWTTVRGWVLSEQGGLRWGKNIGLFLFTLLVFKVLASIVGKIVEQAMRTVRVQASDLLKDFFANVVRKTVFFIGLVVALSMLEVNIGPFMAAMGGAAFVIGFALQGTLSNFAAGVMILMYRPYDIGDLVEAGGAKGVVAKMSLVSTSLTTPDNQIIVVPNGAIWGGIITNMTGNQRRRVDMTFGIGYDDDIAKAEGILKEILEAHPKVLKDPAPVIKLHELADSSVNFVVRPWSKTADYWDVYWDVTRAVKERFDAESISFPYPQSDVHMHQVTPVGASS